MKFWDTSAIVPLLVLEEKTEAALAALQRDQDLGV